MPGVEHCISPAAGRVQTWQPLVHSPQVGLSRPKLKTVAGVASDDDAGGADVSSAKAGATRKRQAARTMRVRFKDMATK